MVTVFAFQFILFLPWLLAGLAITGLIIFSILFAQQNRVLKQFNRKDLVNNLKKLDLLYTLIDNMPDWIYIKDRESKFILANKHMANSHGIENPEVMNGKTDFDYHPEEMARSFYDDEQDIMKSGVPIVNKEEKVVDKLNGEFVLSTTKIPIRDKSRNIVGIVGIGRDITRQKEAEKRLKQLSMVASSTENVVVVMDKDGDFEWVNNGFEARYGCTMQEFIKKKGLNLLINSSNENIAEIVGEINKTKKPYTYSSRTRDIHGNDAWYQTNITPILSEDGEINSLFLIDSDITGIKKADLQIKQQKYELESQRDQLRKLNTRKDRLFSIIAHDLKNPFLSIIGFSDLLKEGYHDLKEEQILEYLDCIHSSSTSAYDLLFNLLEWARAQIKTIDINPEKIGIEHLIGEIMELLAVQAKDKHIQFENSVEPNLKILADRNMVHTILRNLISNAIKFTEVGGSVKFTTKKYKNRVSISVKDSGIGISEEKIKTLFSLEKSKCTIGTSGETGTGLGLLVCKEFLQLNEGKIGVTSKSGYGSTFTITLPASN